MSDAVPITYAQKFIYGVIQQLGPDAPSLQLAACLRIKGPVHAERFERAAAALVARHPILCARLDVADGQLVQRLGIQEASFEAVTISDDIERRADALLSARADKLFDLFSENPHRIVLAQAGDHDAFLLLVGHHMFVDEAALRILLQDYLDLYLADAGAAGEDPDDSSARGFLQHASQQQQMIRDGFFSGKAQYWISYLAQADPSLRLPGRGADPAMQSLESIQFTLAGDAFTAFSERIRRLRVTPFALCASALFHALHEITPQDQLLLSVVSNIRRPPFERTVGQFAGMFLVNHDMRNGEMTGSAIRAVSQEVFKAQKNYVPNFYFADQVGWLRERLANGLSMSDVFVNFLPAAINFSRSADRTGYSVTPFTLTCRTSPSEIAYHGVTMSFAIRPLKDALFCSISYESAIVDAEAARTVKALLTHALSQEV